MKTFSKHWIRSKNPKQQRKYRANAPLHIKQKFVSAHLSKELRQKYKRRSLGLRKGDKVKVMRGQYKKKTGKIDRVDLKNTRVYIEGIDIIKKEGSKALFPINPSNVMIIELNLDDKKRLKEHKK